MDLLDKLFLITVMLPLAIIAVAVGMIITWPLKMLKILKWDYWDYMCFIGDDSTLSYTIPEFYWTQEEFYKIKSRSPVCHIYLETILSLIPKFSGDIYLTVDENPLSGFGEPIMTPGTIKTNLWAWHIHKEKILCELKQKRVAIKEQKMMEDF